MSTTHINEFDRFNRNRGSFVPKDFDFVLKAPSGSLSLSSREREKLLLTQTETPKSQHLCFLSTIGRPLLFTFPIDLKYFKRVRLREKNGGLTWWKYLFWKVFFTYNQTLENKNGNPTKSFSKKMFDIVNYFMSKQTKPKCKLTSRSSLPVTQAYTLTHYTEYIGWSTLFLAVQYF